MAQVEGEPLLPIPVAIEKRPDPRLALTIGVAGWIADSKDFGREQPPLPLQPLHPVTHFCLCSHMLANWVQVLCRAVPLSHSIHLYTCTLVHCCTPVLASQDQVLHRLTT